MSEVMNLNNTWESGMLAARSRAALRRLCGGLDLGLPSLCFSQGA